ncbi:MAG: galactokinase family protein [Oscillospiraceae bacterium]
MSTCNTLLPAVMGGAYDRRLAQVYCCTGSGLDAARARVQSALESWQELYTDNPAVSVFSAPGRTELGGNHTDHQHGRVLCAGVNLDMLACAAKNDSQQVRILSAGYPALVVDLTSLTPREEERETSAALVRGVAACMAARGYPVAGFDATVDSAVPAGSGLSSSAAYEVLVGTIFNHLFCGDALTAVEIAQIGQTAENQFFGKPCGLMDQTASAVGGAVAIDFSNPQRPLVEKVGFDFAASGYTLCILDSGADHADLTAEYAAITDEMGAVARALGQTCLRDVDEAAFLQQLPTLRRKLGDRAMLRALHFFDENRRAGEEAAALDAGDFPRFLALVRESGQSSALYLQNTYATANPRQQAVPLALALAERTLRGAGAVRVHGGGFAGTIQAFVPNDRLADFTQEMERVLGAGSCHALCIRPVGGCVLLE